MARVMMMASVASGAQLRAKATSALCRPVSLAMRGLARKLLPDAVSSGATRAMWGLAPKLIPGAKGMNRGDDPIRRRLCE